MRRFAPVIILLFGTVITYVSSSVTRSDAQEAPAAEKSNETKRAEKRAGKKKKTPDPKADRNERLVELQLDFEERLEQSQERIDDLTARLAELQLKQVTVGEEYVEELLSFAKEKPADPASLEALRTIVVDQLDYITEESLELAFKLLETHHAASPEIGAVCALLGDLEPSAPLDQFLETVIAKNPSPGVRAWALFAQGTHAYQKADEANDSAAFAAAEKLFARAVKEVPADQAEGSPVDVAEKFLFELRNLVPGKPAPDFESEDLAGKTVRLKDLRGKVVVLDFWATWCGYCIDMIPHTREMTKRFADRPFAMIGISADEDSATVSEFMSENPMPWTQWWNGPEGGVIEAWNIQGFPTTYVIDAAGVIRYRNLRGGELEAAVAKLLDETKNVQPKGEK